jgi:hypothetical protein
VDELKSFLANATFAEGPGGDVDRHLHPHLRAAEDLDDDIDDIDDMDDVDAVDDLDDDSDTHTP